jgi:hypothetical protein
MNPHIFPPNPFFMNNALLNFSNMKQIYETDINKESMQLDYENYKINDKVHDTFLDLIEEHPNVTTDEKVIIYLVNNDNGFGFELNVYIQNSIQLQEFNNNIITFPHFSNNTQHFKYHEESLNNSFFMYFKYKQPIHFQEYKIYFARSRYYQSYKALGFSFPLYEKNKNMIDFFRNKYEIKNGNEITNYMKSIKKQKMIGIHIRSIFQQKKYRGDVTLNQLVERLMKLEEKLRTKYEYYSIFLATDVYFYIEECKKIFGNNIHYLKFISRIQNEEDSIPQLEGAKGLKLGNDILSDCLALSLCDEVYVANSNVPLIVTFINPNVDIQEY